MVDRKIRFGKSVVQPAEVAPFSSELLAETAQPRQVALLALPLFIVSGRRKR